MDLQNSRHRKFVGVDWSRQALFLLVQHYEKMAGRGRICKAMNGNNEPGESIYKRDISRFGWLR
jgi:hypothetical protein